jgi:PncC family amidohydrolase
MDLREGEAAAPPVDAAAASDEGPVTDATEHADALVALVALAERLQARCLEAGVTLSTAESCTGGLVGHLITEVPGSSDYYVGGAISYSDAVKHATLGVPEEALERHGAVSAQVAVAMAEGARSVFGSDLAVAVTGIAGPAGGSDAKPVGLTYVAVADAAGHDVQRHHWQGERTENKRESARVALELVLERLSARR